MNLTCLNFFICIYETSKSVGKSILKSIDHTRTFLRHESYVNAPAFLCIFLNGIFTNVAKQKMKNWLTLIKY